MQNPFKFLDSYTKDDRDIFFGRTREIEEIYSRVFESNLLLVCGLPGTGKSPLIHCGLRNKFGVELRNGDTLILREIRSPEINVFI